MVDPNTCGNYAVSSLGRKIKIFLEATVRLETAVNDVVNYVRDTCAIMGRELGMPPGDLQGDTRQVCDRVSAAFEQAWKVGIKAGAKVDVNYQPAVCTVDADLAAKAMAECEAKAAADIDVSCEGTCGGTCHGTCAGNCAGSNKGGKCDGQCDGTCRGRCEGDCNGSATVDGDATCKASAEVNANVEVRCTEPKLDVDVQAGVIIDKSKVEGALAAARAGLPRLIMVHMKMVGPIRTAFLSWSRAATDLSRSSGTFFASLGDQALCVSGQIAAAFGALGRIQGQMTVSVEVSVSVSGSAGASI